MTAFLNTELLLSTLVSRIRAMNTNPTGNTPASVLEDLHAEIHRGEYDVDKSDDARDDSDLDELAVPVQDPLEAAADRIIGSSGFLDTVREIPVGDVVSVQTILYRRADEHEKQAAVIRERRAQMTEALQGLLSPEKREGGAAAPDEYEEYRNAVKREGRVPASMPEYYAATGLRDRNGGR